MTTSHRTSRVLVLAAAALLFLGLGSATAHAQTDSGPYVSDDGQEQGTLGNGDVTEVLGSSVSNAQGTAADTEVLSASVQSSSLPLTGGETLALAGLGGVLVLVGGASVVASRRRARPERSDPGIAVDTSRAQSMRRRLLLGAAVVLACWAAVVVVTAVRTLRAADEARASLATVRSELGVEELVDGTARANLTQLRGHLAEVRRGATSPFLAPLRLVPGAGRQIDAAQDLSGAGLDGTDIGVELLEEMTATIEGPLPAGSERAALVERVRSLVHDSRAAIDALALGDDEGPLFPPLADARRTADEGLADLDEFLGRAEAIAASVQSLLEDGDYLVVAANNAEMRAGSGMFLQVGELGVVDGDLDVGELVPAADVMVPAGAVEATTATYSDLWGYLRPAEEWRNLAVSPRFDVTAELAVRMWEALGNRRPSGVLSVDPYAIRALLRATGPVEVDGEMIGADDVVDLLLNRQYDVFEATNDYGQYREAQDVRRDRLGGLVDATFDALGSGATDPVVLLEELRGTVRGRHLLAWSGDPAVQEGWAAAEMSGTLEADSIMVSILNRGVNKLDPFVDLDVAVRFEDLDEQRLRATMEVTVVNATPDGEVPYVAGPADDVEDIDAYGDYAGILEIVLPGVARNGQVTGVDALQVASPDGPVLTLATEFVLARGGERVFEVTFEVPRSLASVRVEPSARPDPVDWRIGERLLDDDEHHRVPVRPGDR